MFCINAVSTPPPMLQPVKSGTGTLMPAVALALACVYATGPWVRVEGVNVIPPRAPMVHCSSSPIDRGKPLTENAAFCQL